MKTKAELEKMTVSQLSELLQKEAVQIEILKYLKVFIFKDCYMVKQPKKRLINAILYAQEYNELANKYRLN